MLTLSVFFSFLFFVSSFVAPVIAKHGTVHAGSLAESKYYTKAHSLGDGYNFDPRDGWQSVNASNLPYKYRRPDNAFNSENLLQRSTTEAPVNITTSLSDTFKGVVANVWKGLKGIGQPEHVTITWYTGHDLENPSCWTNGNWAPTDDSFVCALTLDGWTTRPQCFKFLELCTRPSICIFVRVVDTCAGCARGSHHVDLTKAAFGILADLNEGTLIVKMRPATEPEMWNEKLWGPKVT